MTPEQDPLIEQFLQETKRLEKQPPGRRFTHSFLPVDLSRVLTSLRSRLQVATPAFSGIFAGIIDLRARNRVYVSEVASGTIVWHAQGLVNMTAALAREFNCQAHWVSVYEDLTSRAYAHFQCDKCDVLVRDPLAGWRDNLWHGEDLIGKGKREYKTLKAFLKHIGQWYQPVDVQWDFEFWDNPKRRGRLLKKGSLKRSIEVAYENRKPVFNVIGDWSPVYLAELTRAFIG